MNRLRVDKVDVLSLKSVAFQFEVPFVEFGPGGNGGGGDVGSGGDDGVAFSIRAQVRKTSKRRSKTPSRMTEGWMQVD